MPFRLRHPRWLRQAGGGPAGGSRQPPHLPEHLILYPVLSQSGCSSTPLPPASPHSIISAILSPPNPAWRSPPPRIIASEALPNCDLPHPRDTSSAPSHSFPQELPTITWSRAPVASVCSRSRLTLDRRKNGLGVSCFLEISSILSCQDVKPGIQDRNSPE